MTVNSIKQMKDTYKTINYSNIVYSYFFSENRRCTEMVKEHFLVYVISGKFLLHESQREIEIGAGESVFLRRDNRVNMYKQIHQDKPFQAIFMQFDRTLLRKIYSDLDKKIKQDQIRPLEKSVIKLPDIPALQGLFQSIIPYFDSSIQPLDEIMELKLREGIYALLSISDSFYPTLFDFTEQWKIDILDFMSKNYMYDLSIDQIASFTGRSLSTFKRDFKKISELSPERWLTQKRLDVAYDQLKHKNKQVSDVYLEVGFKNLSHFSRIFKARYGISPSLLS